MDKNNIKLKSIQDKLYELEGLVLLALNRNNLPEDFFNLIARKGKEIYLDTKSFENKDNLGFGNFEEIENDNYSIEDSEENLKGNVDETLYEKSHEQRDSDNDEFFSSNSDSQEKESRGKLVFSINDRFRFRQSLFDDSDVDFNNTLALVASMDTYEEAEEYFLNEQGWTNNDKNVSAFLEILKKYFK